jgi:hypothetical protein
VQDNVQDLVTKLSPRTTEHQLMRKIIITAAVDESIIAERQVSKLCRQYAVSRQTVIKAVERRRLLEYLLYENQRAVVSLTTSRWAEHTKMGWAATCVSARHAHMCLVHPRALCVCLPQGQAARCLQ